jgi:hypothetical protein
MLQTIASWFKSKGGFAHVAAAVFASLMLAYAAVPSFHALVLQVHQSLPGWLQELVTTGLALYAWYKSNGTKPAAPINTSSTIPPAAKLLLCVVALGSLGLMGCKGPTATAPLAPGYVTAGEQSVGEVIAAASAAVVKYEALKGAPGFVPIPGADATITAIQQTLVIADPLAVAWHNTLLTNSAAAEPAALVTAVNALNNGLAALPGGVK